MLIVTQRYRIDWGHCDPAGIIFNPNYFAWMDAGCHNLFKAARVPFAEMMRDTDFVGCPLVKNEAEFTQPAFYDDIITLASQVESFSGKSFKLLHRFTRGGDLLAEGREIRVWAYGNPMGGTAIKAEPVPDDVKATVSVQGTIDFSS